jgi:hypothetical protein
MTIMFLDRRDFEELNEILKSVYTGKEEEDEQGTVP